MKDILIIGGGGHAKSVIDSILADHTYRVIGYTANEKNDALPFPYLGSDDALEDCFKQGITNAVMGIGFLGGNSHIRDRLFAKAKAIGYCFPTIVDPTAIIAQNAIIGEGSYIGKKVVVNADAVVGEECIINTGAIVEHDCTVGKESHIAVGAVLCGGASVGDRCLIGANATLIQGVSVGNNAIVGAGSVVLDNVPDSKTVGGVPAKIIHSKE